ncbi:MAG: cytochrome P450, partial [Candidatus Azotimanducaceae bacterium]
MTVKKTLFRTTAQVALHVLNTIDVIAYGQGAHPGKEENCKNPYPWLKKLRSKAPVLRSYANRGWIVLGFDEVQAAFKDPRFSSDMRNNQFIVSILRAAADGKTVQLLDDPSMLSLDAPDHTRLR